MAHLLFLIESARANGSSVVPNLLKKGYRVHRFDKIADACIQKDLDPSLVIIHAAAIQSSGMQILRKAKARFAVPILLISVDGTRLLPDGPGFDHLLPPFTIRKLNNRIKRLLPPRPSTTQKVGTLRLVPKRNQLILDNALITLTPMAFRLLRALVRKPGEIISREQLMREVWETDYVGDTRTIDTHISWLRTAMGQGGAGRNQPRIVTVRNKGYRLIEGPTAA